ncbi:hypothetical protein V1L54_10725 [Streptomyces sp. TRM 70361]|uniref:hypothetical protein n=1 Tax=Streptomyces sp. TRM 70361 TaxID=3116553 RepID=UPI002E7B113A|nr:hypothetical protein [Streptomyces sp. TRM 70361]MEE1939874.1 hypothetical protein [Streptomyces sp. TRM 70361]
MATETSRNGRQSATEPWWRFVPKNRNQGYLILLTGILLVVISLLNFFTADLSAPLTALMIAVGLLGVVQIARAADGLRALRR